MHDSEQKDASGFFLKMIFNCILIQAVSANILESNVKHESLGNTGKGDRPPDSVASQP